MKINIHERNREEDLLRINFSGDFCPVNLEQFDRDDFHEVFDGALLKELQEKDYLITNLECPLTDQRFSISKSGPPLKAPPPRIGLLKEAGIDVVTLANNHIMDYGDMGLADTISMCDKNNIMYTGAGMNMKEAACPLYLKKNNIRMAILAITEEEFSIAGEDKAGCLPLDPVKNYYMIQKAKKNADLVIVIVHAGNEHYELPRPGLKETFRFFADAGASAVIGHHPHNAGPFEVYKGVPLIYSLGNFLFNWPGEDYSPWFEGYFVKMLFNRQAAVSFELVPYTQFKDGSKKLEMMKEKEREQFFVHIKELNLQLKDDKVLLEKWNQFAEQRKLSFLKRISNYNNFDKLMLKAGFKDPQKPFDRRKALSLLNLFRCESHRDLMIKILENYLNQNIENAGRNS